jgi:phosphoribosyl 1,2-cyclic phosphate phosphodiesterase
MRLTLLGSGDAGQVPVYNCACAACAAARLDPQRRRGLCCALIECGEQRWLIDAGLTDLTERFAPHSLSGILQTHYHADHAQGLLHLRWGRGLKIAVHGPADPDGFADLFKHPGILDFSQPFRAFERRQWGPLSVSAVPLNHSKPTFGYLLEQHGDAALGLPPASSEHGSSPALDLHPPHWPTPTPPVRPLGQHQSSGPPPPPGAGRRIAYLTDTLGVPSATVAFLRDRPLDVLVLDCSQAPQPQAPRNHNDLTRALEVIEQLQPAATVLTHIGHDFDAWLLAHPAALPPGVSLAWDGRVL